jgi:hypothetical protein
MPLSPGWRLEAIGDPGPIGPQTGSGNLSGDSQSETIAINLNPGMMDNKVFRSGVIRK